MIYVSQGHESGVGLEIFIKAFLTLSPTDQKKFHLFADRSSLIKTLDSIAINHEVAKDTLKLVHSQLQVSFIKKAKNPTTDSLMEILEIITDKDILLTLPSSKDQIIFEEKNVNGYTEFFRNHYQKDDIGMSFLSPNDNILLLSDHISIADVCDKLTVDFVVNKVISSVYGLQKIKKINSIRFSGIDPHCGEGGLISTIDNNISQAIQRLQKEFKDIVFSGPFPADTIHFQPKEKHQLLIYASHDQGLGPFKLKNGLCGINLSLGLPFYRVSVDHGTAFDLYGKNKASYQGMLYLLNEIVSWT
ncbi:MAG: hypothetical protein CME62_17240 [Halobacteriovoraceae bacterium]|nr:hypothetical protein [Halobacteriovoraceae bacterium]|tara:strand:+ start:6153 stop:7061 length:909 start_codon:yes stop_codon:yes gene_type:complete